MTTGKRFGLAVAVVLAGVNAIGALRVQAVPRYSARYEQTCALCHVNPTGGGMRTTYASQEMVPKEFAWSPPDSGFLADLDPRLSKHVTIGADFREIYATSDVDANHLGFFQMQGDAYLAFQLEAKSTLYYDRGLSNTYELFGLHYWRPWAYVKAGRFVPAYGWKFDDHTHFVRSDLGFFPPGSSDVGLELGFTPSRFDLQLSLLNGQRGSVQDGDRKLAVGVNALYRFRVGPVGAGAGFEGLHQPGRLEDVVSGGLHGYLTWENLFWLGQGDLVRRDPALGGETTGLATSHEFTWLIRRGLELKATYDFFDPDTRLGSGARTRFGGGVFLMPRSYLALEGLYRSLQVDGGPALPGVDYNEAVLQLHILY